MIAAVNIGACEKHACANCAAVRICDIGAIVRIDDDEPVIVNHANCNGCAECVTACPHGVISLVES